MKNWLLLLCICCLPLAAYAQFSGIHKGDILEINGTKGIVFQIDNSGEHGTMMSIKALRGVKNSWCVNAKHAAKIQAKSKTDGKENQREITDYIKQNGLSLDIFPAYKWCKSLGEGWYIPAVEQLEVFINYWLGNDNELDWDEDCEDDYVIDESISQPKLVNKILIEAGGVPFLNGVYTSTKNEKGKVYVYEYNRTKNWWKFYTWDPMRMDLYTVARAFYNF